MLTLSLWTSAETPDNATTSWDYSEHKDEMGRGTTKLAYLKSVNAVSFGVPYEGEQHATLVLRKSPKDGNDAILQVERGQFTSSYVQNFVTLRFDKGGLQKFVIGDAADGTGNVLFIRHYDRLVTQLRTAKTLKIEATLYREGSRVFEFDVHGLDRSW
jgi:hypothetical protein